ncbi:MAG: type I glyceraldehyde-3-phosphate dehydrogenase [Patescibacteria group bacterium]|nr:type I glyceraldehyde-3-phosphate dehydrogenase [Patescibacteria group bacterium]
MAQKKIKVAINGFGRIGRAAFRIILNEHPEIQVVAINDLVGAEDLAQLLQFDTCYGRFDKKISVKGKNLLIKGQRYLVFAEKDPANLPWKKLEVDVVLECTGRFRGAEDAAIHLKSGAKKVIISAPGKGCKTIVLGVNEKSIKKNDQVISCASCTTNCLAPLTSVIVKEFGVKKALMSTIHAYTGDQNLVDGPHPKDRRRARAAAANIVPTTTGAAVAVTETIPSLAGKFDGMALRVPVPVGSLCDVTFLLNKKTSAKEVNKKFQQAASGRLKNILEASNYELVSSDIIGNPHSAIVDLPSTTIVGGDLLKVVAWYDNEWGYSQRLVELATYLKKYLN